MHFCSYRRGRRRGRGLKLLCLIFIAVLILMIAAAAAQLRPIMGSMATARVSNVIHKAVAEAVTETIGTGNYNYSDLI